MVKDFIALTDYSREEIEQLLDFADSLKAGIKAGETQRHLAGKTVAMLFEKPSLRTRVTFETGVFQMGGHAIYFQTSLGERETVADMARNLDRWVDCVVARTFKHEHVVELAEYCDHAPVVNGLTDFNHPCQILADVQALREHRGKDFTGFKLAFVGDGNNVFNSWANFARRVPMDLTLVCPPGYEADSEFVAQARAEAAGKIEITDDLEGVRGAHAVYTDVWASMGQEQEAARRQRDFGRYQVNASLMALADKDALFLHCLPAHRGSEVTDEVIDSPQSIVFDQAENRLHAQKAVLATLVR
ncbi:MAG: ornithine carbamoyltransferase [Candidatus Hydrogenedens sp.]|nr:ornithine carbamoyltransferase [Candidatus Hydrogenedens sp.]